MTEFAAQSVQFAWFVTDTSGLAAASLMVDVLALDPDIVQTNRTPSPQMPFLSSASRAEGQLKFVLNVSPGRVDLFIQSATEPNETPIPVIDARQAFDSVIKGLERKEAVGLKNVYRFAVVSNFLEQKENLEASNRAFSEKVGIPYIGGAMDQSFGLNVRKAIDGIEGEVNRLVRYSVDTLQQLEMIAPAPGVFDFNNGRIIKESFFLRTAIDVNNVPVNAVFFDAPQILMMSKAFSQENISLYEMRQISEIA